MSSFGRDVLYKVLSQGISFATSLVTMGLVARSLGPSAYGIYNFIADFFQKKSFCFFLPILSAILYYTHHVTHRCNRIKE